MLVILIRGLCLVSYEHDGYALALVVGQLVLDVAPPVVYHVVASPLVRVVHDQRAHRILVVDLRHRPEALLARNVPQLQVHARLRVHVHHLQRKVHAHRRLVRAREEVVHEALNDRCLSGREMPDNDELQAVLLHTGGRRVHTLIKRKRRSQGIGYCGSK